jgi:hypothetical protein
MLIERNKDMSETKDEQGTENTIGDSSTIIQHFSGESSKKRPRNKEKEQIRNVLRDNVLSNVSALDTVIRVLIKLGFDPSLILEVIKEENEEILAKNVKEGKLRAMEQQQSDPKAMLFYGIAQNELMKSFGAAVSSWSLSNAENPLMQQQLDAAVRSIRHLKQQQSNPITVHFRIIEEPLTPQNLALAFTTLTELATKFWLIAKRRLPDLIEYTQTHDIRFANEAGSAIAWATYNSPFSFGFQVDKVVPSVADALMTVVNGLSQRKAHVEKLELDNQAAEQKIKEDEKRSELEQTKEQLAIERERVALLRETMEAQKQGIEYAIEITKTLVDITYPNADIETKGMIITTLLPGVLQLDNVRGLQLVLPETLPLGSKVTLDNTEPKQDTGQ